MILVLLWSFIYMLGYVVLLYSLSDFGKTIGLSDEQAASNRVFEFGYSSRQTLHWRRQ